MNRTLEERADTSPACLIVGFLIDRSNQPRSGVGGRARMGETLREGQVQISLSQETRYQGNIKIWQISNRWPPRDVRKSVIIVSELEHTVGRSLSGEGIGLPEFRGRGNDGEKQNGRAGRMIFWWSIENGNRRLRSVDRFNYDDSAIAGQSGQRRVVQ